MRKSFRAQEPLAPYLADEERVQAKLFANGRSQAIRLPKQFRMPGATVWIHREGKRLIIEAEADGEADVEAWLAEMRNLAAHSKPDPDAEDISDFMQALRDER